MRTTHFAEGPDHRAPVGAFAMSQNRHNTDTRPGPAAGCIPSTAYIPGGTMRIRTTILAASAGALLTLTGCGTGDLGNEPDPTAATAVPPAKTDNPAEPNPAESKALIDALTAIDPDIVHGKPEKAIRRGQSQCESIKSTPNDQAKLLELTNLRFTSPDHPDGFGDAKSEQILDALRKHLCPNS